MKVTKTIRPVIKFVSDNELLEQWFWDEAMKWFTNAMDKPDIPPMTTVMYRRQYDRIDVSEIPVPEPITHITLHVGRDVVLLDIYQRLAKLGTDPVHYAIVEAVKALRD